jgi:putative oxidoreductase
VWGEEAAMHRFVWVLQIVLGVYFVAIGVMHFVVPEGLPDQMGWMYDLPAWLHYASGTAEILGGLGLILPGLTRIRPQLTPVAAAGLIIVMVIAAMWHVPRGEVQNVLANVVLVAILAFVGYVRWRKLPLRERSTV